MGSRGLAPLQGVLKGARCDLERQEAEGVGHPCHKPPLFFLTVKCDCPVVEGMLPHSAVVL